MFVYLFLITVICNEFLVGMGWGWTAPTLLKLCSPDSVIPMTVFQASWIGSINELGRLLGPFISPFLVDKIGRKFTLILVTIFLYIFWLAIIFIRNVHALYAARIMFGMTNGISDVVSTIYTTENCSPSFRGIIGGLVLVMYFAGILAEFILATYLSYSCAALVNAVISICTLVTIFFGTETPYFLIMKGKYEKAERNYIWLKGGDEQYIVFDEMEKIKQNVLEEKLKRKSISTLLLGKDNLKSILIVTGLYLLSTTTGVSAMTAYASLMFPPSKFLTSNEYTILYGVAKLVAVSSSLFMIENFNRRSLLIVSFIICSICNGSAYILYYSFEKNSEVRLYPWFIFMSITLYSSVFALVYPALYVIRGEILPFSVKTIGGCIAVISQSSISFTIAKMFFPIEQRFGMKANFLFYFIMSLATTIFVYFTVPETRGKTLEEMRKSSRVSPHADVVVTTM